MKTILLDNLNDAQQQAVAAPLGHQLISAGAGSGKTRVLVHRIAWVAQIEGLPAESILAVTFTNKAANEMRSRLESLLGPMAKKMWIGTFHSIAHRMLRLHWQEAHLPEGFQILDSSDQLRLVKRAMAHLGLDEKKILPKNAQWFINAKKDEGLEPKDITQHQGFPTKTFATIYQIYQGLCQSSGTIDFADLLLKVKQLWQNHPSILQQYRQRFRYILVDEFQDTNALQYAWIKLLTGNENYIMIVGDEDQSIYGWRGAKIENLIRFHQDFPQAMTIRLEQNYRSTRIILQAANALIANNTGRLGKSLWSAGEQGEHITVYAGLNDIDEAHYIVNQIRNWQRAEKPLHEIAILFRSNAQSRILEATLTQFHIPYCVRSGLRYFERAEIKDALAYLRLITNVFDGTAFERVVNMPARGIGEKTIETLQDYAQQHNLSLWQSAKIHLEQSLLPPRATQALQGFIYLIEELIEETKNLTLSETIDHTIKKSGLLTHFRQEKGEIGLARIENLDELVNAARQFEKQTQDLESPLAEFLAHTALSSEDDLDTMGNNVQLMTLHAAKGLEFPIVFLCGCEDGLFPHYMSMDSPEGIEEERRLCYVGMTRAMKKLYLTRAEVRRMHGKEMKHKPSRFLEEIPNELLQQKTIRTQVTYPKAFPNKKDTLSHSEGFSSCNGISVGQIVMHQIFGEGVVLQFEGQGETTRIQVRFKTAGTKWLIASFVKATA